MDTVNFKQHPVFRQFLNDRRFSFRPDNYIDMVFEERDADALQLGRFKVSVVQDFGGESVVKCGDKFGIIFDLPA